jgi:hypothetical protein
MNNLLEFHEKITDIIAKKQLKRGTDRWKDVLIRAKDIAHPIELIKIALSNKANLATIARNSYSHIYGFDKIVLISSSSPHYCLRLHVWWGDSIASIENAHNHRWDFASNLLLGRYCIDIYTDTLKGESMNVYNCYTPKQGKCYRIEFLGQKLLQKTHSIELSQGSVYQLSYFVIHRVLQSALEPTISLVLQGPARKAAFQMYSDINVSTMPFPARRFSVKEVRNKLEKILTLLA